MCEQCDKVKGLIAEWLSKQGHDRCWYYPDIFSAIAAIYELATPDFSLPPREEFRTNCLRYEAEQYSK